MDEPKARLPWVDLDGYGSHRRLASVAGFFTVGLLARYVAWKLASTAGTAAATSVRSRRAPATH
jgi:hypothetical protein